MAVERTLSIIKPDAVAKNLIGEIVARFEAAGLKVVASRTAPSGHRSPCGRKMSFGNAYLPQCMKRLFFTKCIN